MRARMSFRMRLLLLSFPLLAAACASGTLDPQWATREVEVVEAGAFRAAGPLPAGFDDLVEDARVRVGDQVLFGLRLQRGESVRDWFLHVVVEGIEPGAVLAGGGLREVVRLRVAVADANGEQLGVESTQLVRDYLERGLARACRGEGVRDDEGVAFGRTEEWPERFRALLALSQVLRIARESPILRPLLYEVVDPPSVWSVIAHLGVRLSTRMHFDDVRAVGGEPLGAAIVPAWSLPHELLINGAPALQSHILVTDPRSPLTLCAGILAITSTHPTDPSRVFTMRLLAARRGPAD